MKIIQISESEFSVKGHGVHTAYIETVKALEEHTDYEVATNSLAVADIRHIHTVGPYALWQLLFARGRKVVSAHVVPESFIGSLSGAKYWIKIARLYLRWFYSRSDVVIAVSDYTRDELRQLGVKVPIEVMYNMIDIGRYRNLSEDRLAIRQKLGIPKDAKLVIGNGQIQPRKRFDSFVEIAKKMPHVQFIWIGGMPFGKVAAEHESMQNLIDTAPKNVKVTGVIDLDQVAEYYCAGDVFVMTSVQETFGLAIVEAAASGLPVVLRDIPDYDSTFRGNAIMASEDEFVEQISRLLDDESYYRQWRDQAAQLASKYSSAVGVKRLVAIYERLIDSK